MLLSLKVKYSSRHLAYVFNPVIYMAVYIKRTKAVPNAHLHISHHYLSACAAENLIP